jgi:NosR/NirI family nitrous oxide reductase transcriptional regulator
VIHTQKASVSFRQRNYQVVLVRFLLVVSFAYLYMGSTAHCDDDPSTVSANGFRIVPRFGMEVADVTPEIAVEAGLDKVKGCVVQLVIASSPSEKAGVEAGDIIVSLNNRGIRNAREFQNDISGLDPGREARICVVRDDYRTTLTIVPSEYYTRISIVDRNPPYLGVRVSDLAEDSAEMHGLEERGKEGGVLVTTVAPGSPAEKAGIEPGDVIMSFNSRKVRTALEFVTDLSGAEVGDSVRICIMRAEIRKTLYPVLTKRPGPSLLTVAYETTNRETLSSIVSRRQLFEVLPEATDFVYQIRPVPHYKAYGRGDDFVGLAYVNTEICPDESQGYHGQIVILVGLDARGTIVGVKVIEHTESLNFYQKRQLDNFVKQYVDRSDTDDLVFGKDIDAVSGATITSSAIHHSITRSRSIVLAAVLDDRSLLTDRSSEQASWSRIAWQADFLTLLCISGIAVFGYIQRRRMIRYFVLGCSLGYLGFIKGGGLSIHDVINMLENDFPLMVNTAYWYGLLFVVALTTVFIGRFYCGWLCPFGALTEMLYRVFPRLKVAVPSRFDPWLRSIKYLILLAILVTVFVIKAPVAGKVLAENTEPFGTLFRVFGTLWMWIFLFFLLAASVLISRPYCRYLCPLGALLALLTMLASFILRKIFGIDPEKGRTKGGVPIGGCPMGAVAYEKTFLEMSVQNGECIKCTHPS